MPDLMLTEEERMLQSTVREFVDREVAPRAGEVDQREEFSWENWNGMAKLGLMGSSLNQTLLPSDSMTNPSPRATRSKQALSPTWT